MIVLRCLNIGNPIINNMWYLFCITHNKLIDANCYDKKFQAISLRKKDETMKDQGFIYKNDDFTNILQYICLSDPH